ncbi:hypothetical protein Tco_1053209, partial [Tanacetum coccineum]
MYERPPTTPSQNPPRNTTFPFQNNILMFQQHQGESLYDVYTQIDIDYAAGGNLRRLSAEEAWETIEDCAQCDKQWKNPTSTISNQTYHSLNLWGNLRRLSAEEAWETIKDCAQCDKQWKNPTSTISNQTIANLKNQLVKNEVVRVKIPKCMAWLNDEPIRDLGTMEDKVDNPSPQSTPQVLPSFEVYTLHVTHPEEVEETIGIPMEVEPLDHMKLEDLSFDTSTHDLFLIVEVEGGNMVMSVDDVERVQFVVENDHGCGETGDENAAPVN